MTARLPVVEPLQRALHLHSLDLFSDLGAHELALLAALMQEQWLRRGEVLHAVGQRVHAVHLLVEGQVRLEKAGGIAGSIQPPEVIGLIELLAQVETPTRAVADTNALALVMDGNALFDVIEDHFSIFLQIRAALARRLRPLQRQLGQSATWHPRAVTKPGPPPVAPLELAAQLIWLHRVPELRDLGVGVLASLIRNQAEKRFDPGEALWADDSPAQFFVLIIDGVVRCGNDESGGSARAGAGTVLGMDAVFAGTTHAYAAVAETAVVAIRLQTAALLDLAEDHFHVAVLMLAHSARLLLRSLEDRSGGSSIDRADGGAP